jgi:hypothetical protein
VSDERSDGGLVAAVVDRIVDGRIAVLQLDPDGTEVELDARELPAGVAEGTWLQVDPSADAVRVVAVDEARTAARRRDAGERMRRLREGRRGGRFDRDR